MTWQPINLSEVAHQLNIEILRAAANGHVNAHREDGYVIYGYDHEAGDYQFEGSDVTEEVCDLVRDGLLVGRPGTVEITDAGRAFLAEVDA